MTDDNATLSGRDALLDATVRVTARDGLRGVTYRSVAAEAGFTHGLVAHHFGSRDALLEAALARVLRLNMESSRLTSDGPGFDGLAAGLIRFVTADPDLQIFQYELLFESRRKTELSPLVTSLYATYREAVLGELRANGLDDPDLAHLVTSALDGLVLQQVSIADVDSTARALDVLRRILRTYAEHGLSI